MKLPRAYIVLANLMSSKGEPNHETKARIDLAINLDSKLPSDVILLCGWAYRPDCSLAIANAMKAYILEQSPNLSGKVASQKLSRDTVGDAIFSRLYLNELYSGFSSFDLTVITSDYHRKRTHEIFNFIFGKSSFIVVDDVPGFNSKIKSAQELQSLKAFRKTFDKTLAGDLNSIYAALMNDHPFYNGAIYPQIEEMKKVSSRIKRDLVSR